MKIYLEKREKKFLAKQCDSYLNNENKIRLKFLFGFNFFFFFSTSPYYRKLTETTNNFIMNEFFFSKLLSRGLSPRIHCLNS